MRKISLIILAIFIFNSFHFVFSRSKRIYSKRVKDISYKSHSKKGIKKNGGRKKACPCMQGKKKKKQKKEEKKKRAIKVENSITTHEAKAIMGSSLFVCVLPEEYYEKWHISGSINVPWDVIGAVAVNWDRDGDITLYCFTDRTSSVAYETLDEMGFTNIKIISGGIKQWMEDGYQIEGPGTYEELLGLIAKILAALTEED